LLFVDCTLLLERLLVRGLTRRRDLEKKARTVKLLDGRDIGRIRMCLEVAPLSK
jgi:hypothetical protein